MVCAAAAVAGGVVLLGVLFKGIAPEEEPPGASAAAPAQRGAHVAQNTRSTSTDPVEGSTPARSGGARVAASGAATADNPPQAVAGSTTDPQGAPKPAATAAARGDEAAAPAADPSGSPATVEPPAGPTGHASDARRFVDDVLTALPRYQEWDIAHRQMLAGALSQPDEVQRCAALLAVMQKAWQAVHVEALRRARDALRATRYGAARTARWLVAVSTDLPPGRGQEHEQAKLDAVAWLVEAAEQDALFHVYDEALLLANADEVRKRIVGTSLAQDQRGKVIEQRSAIESHSQHIDRQRAQYRAYLQALDPATGQPRDAASRLVLVAASLIGRPPARCGIARRLRATGRGRSGAQPSPQGADDGPAAACGCAFVDRRRRQRAGQGRRRYQEAFYRVALELVMAMDGMASKPDAQALLGELKSRGIVPDSGRAAPRGAASAKLAPQQTSSIGLKPALIAPGECLMGSPLRGYPKTALAASGMDTPY